MRMRLSSCACEAPAFQRIKKAKMIKTFLFRGIASPLFPSQLFFCLFDEADIDVVRVRRRFLALVFPGLFPQVEGFLDRLFADRAVYRERLEFFDQIVVIRSEERRVGKECRSR